MIRPARFVPASLLIASLLAGCAEPASTYSDYRAKAANSVKKMIGVVAAGQLAAQLDLKDKMFATLTDNVVSNAESDASSAQSSFDTRQPPDARSLRLKNVVDGPLQDATNQLTDLRIAVRNADQQGMRSALNDLAKTTAALNKLQDQL